jgi:hypothetical protein
MESDDTPERRFLNANYRATTDAVAEHNNRQRIQEYDRKSNFFLRNIVQSRYFFTRTNGWITGNVPNKNRFFRGPNSFVFLIVNFWKKKIFFYISEYRNVCRIEWCKNQLIISNN